MVPALFLVWTVAVHVADYASSELVWLVAISSCRDVVTTDVARCCLALDELACALSCERDLLDKLMRADAHVSLVIDVPEV